MVIVARQRLNSQIQQTFRPEADNYQGIEISAKMLSSYALILMEILGYADEVGSSDEDSVLPLNALTDDLHGLQ